MVKTQNISQYDGQLPEQGDVRKISGGPLYSKDLVRDILKRAAGTQQSVVPLTQKCIKDLQRYELDHVDLVELLSLALQQDRYKGSEWCESKSGGAWVACDAYQVQRSEYVAAQERSYPIEYYVKFAVSRQGTVLLLVSCHY